MTNLCLTATTRQPAATPRPDQSPLPTSLAGECHPTHKITRFAWKACPRGFVWSLVVTLMMATLLPRLWATPYDWTGASTSSWSDNNSWSPALAFPVAGDDATFPGGLTAGQSFLNIGAGQTVDSLTFNVSQNFYIYASSFGASLNLGNASGSSIAQNSASLGIVFADVTCTSPCTLGGTGSGAVSITGALLGNPALIVNGAIYNIGTGNAGGGITLQSITVNGGTLNIGMSNNVTVTGSVIVNSGGTLRLCNPGVSSATLGLPSLIVNAGGTFYGNASVSASTSSFFAAGSSIFPGCSPSTLTFSGGLTLSVGTSVNFELDTPGVVGGGVNDLINVTGNLNLGGTLNVIAYPGFGIGTYRLFNYTGTLTGPGLLFGTLPAGYFYSIETTTFGQVNLIVSAPLPFNLTTGYNYIVNPVNGTGGNNVNNAAFLQMPAGLSDPNGVNNAILYVWNCVGFDAYQYFTGVDADNYFLLTSSVDGWYDGGGNLASSKIWNSGQGMIIRNFGGPATLTFSGSAPVLTVPTPLPCGCGRYNLLGNLTSGPGTYENVLGRAPQDGAQVFRYNVGQALGSYTTYDFSGGSWTPNPPVLTNGEAAFFMVPCVTNPCTTNLVINGSFEITSPTVNPNSTRNNLSATIGVLGWTTTAGNTLEVWGNTLNGLPASAGTNHMEINARSNDQTVTQVVTNLSTNCLTTFCFDYTGRFGLVSNIYNNDFTVTLSGGYSYSEDLNPAIYSVGGWTNRCISFYPTTSTITIAFRGHPHYVNGTATQGGAHIDRVSLIQCCSTNPCSAPLAVSCSPDKTNECGAAWSFDPPTASSPCCPTNPTVTILNTVTNGNCPKVATRVWRITDCFNNSATCTQRVTLVDSTLPVITCAADKTIPCGAAVIFNSPSVYDNCSGTNVTLTFTNLSSGPCPKTYTRIWTATDLCGNAATCSQTITVVDNQAPVIVCPTKKTIVNTDINCLIRIPKFHPKATDNCTPASQLIYTQNPAAGTLVSGPCQTVTITVKDLCNNASQCQVQVCGQDKRRPKVIAPKSVTVTNCIVPNLLPYLTATDNCTPANQLKYTQSPPAGTLIAAGGNIVTITVTDLAGNTTTIIISLVNTGTQSFLGSLFNTGVNASKVLLPGAALDTHYTLFPAPAGGPSTYVATLPAWGLPSAYSKWIAPAPDSRIGYPFGFYTYKHQPFSLPSGSDPATASISGRWAADDKGKMYLGSSGTPLSTHTSKDKKWTYFTINSGLLLSGNVLRFEVENTTGFFTRPTGLRVEFTNALVNCHTCTPPAVVWITPSKSLPNGSASVVFTASVWGTPALTYQWYHDGIALVNNAHYSGVNTASLTIKPVGYADAGNYYVSIANPCGGISSVKRKLTVTKKWWDYPWAAWDFAQNENPMLATYGPDLVLVSTNDLGISAGTTADFELPSLGGQIADVMHVPGLAGDTLIQLPLIAPPGSNTLNSYTLIMDVYRPAGSTGTNTLFQIGSSGQDGVRLVEGRDGHMEVTGTVGGQPFGLVATNPMPTGTWNRVAIVVDNPQENPLDDASLTLYVNGEYAGGLTLTGVPHVPILPGLTLDWSAGNPATLFTSPDGTSGETYVASVQFHAVALTPETIAGLGDTDSGPMPANDTSVGVEPVLSATQSNGQINLSWTGSAYVLQETDDLVRGNWVDSGVAFEESEVNGDVLTTAHANPALAGPVKFYRLIYTP